VISNIGVGTDGSETASAAVALAVELAREHGAKLHLVVGVHSPAAVAVPAGGANVSDPSGGGLLRGVAQQMLEGVAGDLEGLETEIHTGVGDPAAVIISTADEVGADLIVVGSKGLRGSRRILGSVPNTVAHKAGCHVLIARTT
jgi:nucleotide-binding universal stress UspA family protein